MVVHVSVPVCTEVIAANPDCAFSGAYEDGALVITIDTGNQNLHQRLGLATKTKLHWGAEHEIMIQELSALAWPIRSRLLTRDGYYIDREGERVHFTTAARGLDARRGVSLVLMRAAVLLVRVAGVGYRRAAWLLMELFHVEVSKSALHRWVEEIATSLPDSDEISKALDAKQPITEAHFDELFPRGSDACVLVLKDEHGRIIATQEVERARRGERHAVPSTNEGCGPQFVSLLPRRVHGLLQRDPLRLWLCGRHPVRLLPHPAECVAAAVEMGRGAPAEDSRQ